MKKIYYLFFVFLLATNMTLFAQERVITGKITSSEDNTPMIGVNVIVKGTSIGSISDANGDYSVKISGATSTLTFSFIGYKSKEVEISNQSTVDISLDPDVIGVQEVVVTALGIKREKKALGYAMQEVKGDAIIEARDNQNVMNGLNGKVAGLQINGSGTGGGSTNIIIRGQTSLAGATPPLLVVDGVIVSNYNGGTDDQWGNRAVDHGSSYQDFNPDDIASVSVLKGASASALYGSQAAGGVILISTKKGTNTGGRIGITFNSNNQFTQAASYIKTQNEYGQGTGGAFELHGTTSWGSKMDGNSITDWTNQTRPYSPANNDLLKDFLKTGFTTTNNVEISTGNEKVQFVGSFSDLRSTGIVPNEKNTRNTFNLRTTANITEKLSVDVKTNYIHSTSDNKPKLAFDPDNVFINYLMMPRNIRFTDLENYTTDGLPTRYDYTSPGVVGQGGYILNPYWTVNKNTNDEVRDRFMGMANIQYKLTSKFDIRFRQGLDFWTSTYQDRLATGVPYWQPTGDYILQKSNFLSNTTEAFLNYGDNNVADSKIGINIMGGASYIDTKTGFTSLTTNGLVIPDFFAISNAKSLSAKNTPTEEAISSILGSAQISYDNWAYLDITGRNDWSSTLAKDNWSYFYPSFNLSIIVSEMLRLPSAISFLKVRGGYAEVGKATQPYFTQMTFDMRPMISGALGAYPPSSFPMDNILPERTKSIETGLDIRFLQNRIGLDVSYYKKNTYNQIIRLAVAPTTGFATNLINAGNIQNQGVEVTLNLVPVRLSNSFEWDIDVNWNKNKNLIVELYKDTKQQPLIPPPFTGPIQVVATENGSFGDLIGTTYTRQDGQIVVDDKGVPSVNTTQSKIGNYLPDWIAGINNTFTYKGINLSFLIDIHQGGEFYAGSLRQAYTSGTAEGTLANRDGGLVVKGVDANGSPNTTAINAQTYWNALGGISEAWIRDASTVRLRELSVGYSLPKTLLGTSPVKSVKLSFVARNLWLISSHADGLDPEAASYSTGNAQGIEIGSVPSTRTYGFNISVGF